jgi:hypothetical protein
MITTPPLIIQLFNNHLKIETLSLNDWDLIIRQARASMSLGKLSYFLEDTVIPEKIWHHLESAKIHSDKQINDLNWEIRHLKKVAADLGFPLILLKGAAYAVIKHMASKGRLFSDIDLLVPVEKIAETERKLLMNGWIGTNQSAYDQHYYREWMHEIPPVQHIFRQSVIDLHHNILPLSTAISPNAKLLIEKAENVDGQVGIKVLQPVDMVIHSATHLFHDGELEHGLRDLLDLDSLIKSLDDTHGNLADRAFELGLQRPLFYAIHYSTKILETPISPESFRKIQSVSPNVLMLKIMDFLFMRALMPNHSSCNDCWTGFARWLLYIRSHWLRMPIHLLIPHLARKSWLQFTGKSDH